MIISAPPPPAQTHFARQLAPYEPYNSASPSPSPCPSIVLSVGGEVIVNLTSTLTITTPITYVPPCPTQIPYLGDFTNSTTTFADNNAKFRASTTPLIYVVSASTVIAWTLLVVLLITPRLPSNSVSGSRQSIIPGSKLLSALFGKDGAPGSRTRPLLQKLASLLVAVALTIATADTIKVAERQYYRGWFNGTAMREDVAGSLEIRVTRVISDVFIWLAQVQTLIRLFPRHREKLVIKWVGFVLIVLECVFTSLDSFLINSRNRPRDFQDAIPALAYLFQLSLSLLYAAWVLYYVATKRRYAFYHPKMPNICIIAILSLTAILIPVVFFVVDITEPSIGGWGDYFRWVGAAAASIIVWEWVERIEALEREQRSDGILGREVYDGDEMIDPSPSDALSSSNHQSDDFGSQGQSGFSSSTPRKASGKPAYNVLWRWLSDHPKKVELEVQEKSVERPVMKTKRQKSNQKTQRQSESDAENIRPIQDAAASINRDESNSAGTVYAVHYHSVSVSPPPQQPNSGTGREGMTHTDVSDSQNESFGGTRATNEPIPEQSNNLRAGPPASQNPGTTSNTFLSLAASAFKRRKKSPPLEVKKALSIDMTSQTNRPARRNIMSILSSHNSDTIGSDAVSQTTQEPTIIPAPPRGQTWSPSLQRHSPVQPKREEGTELRNGTPIQQPTNISSVLYSQEHTIPNIQSNNMTSKPDSPVNGSEDLPDKTDGRNLAQDTGDGQKGETVQPEGGTGVDHNEENKNPIEGAGEA